MLKKLVAAGMTAVMCFGLAGCGGEKEVSSVPTLRWLVPGDTQSDLQTVLDAANEIVEKEIGAKINIEFIDEGAFTEKVKLMMAGGNDFDMTFTGYVNNYKTAVDNGGLLEITDMIDKVEGLREAIPDYAWEASKMHGKIYAVPNVQIMAMANSVVAFDDIAAKYNFNFDNVNHIDDLEPYFEMVKKGENGIFPYRPNYGVLQWTTNYDTPASMIALPRGSKSADGLVYLFDTPEWNHGVEQLWNWYKKGYIRTDALSIGDDTADYKNGKYAVANEVWKPGVEIEAKALLGGRDVTFIPIEKPYMTKGRCTATMIGIGAKCKNPEKALQFIKLINTNKELYNIITLGVEGKHYEMQDGKAHLIDGSGYTNNGAGWKFGCVYNTFLVEGQDDDIWEQTEKVNNESEKSTLLGFSFDNSKVKSQISNIATVVSEYNQLDRGVQNPAEYIDTFKAKLKEAGISDVYNEVKVQLEEYFKSQE